MDSDRTSPASAPALVVAGALVMGSAGGSAAAGLPMGMAAFAAALGALAALAGAAGSGFLRDRPTATPRGTTLSRRSPLPILPVVVLAFLASGRSLHATWGHSALGRATEAASPLTLAGRVTRDTRAGVRRGLATWKLHEVAVGERAPEPQGNAEALLSRPGPSGLRVRSVDGALGSGDRVVLLPSTERRVRARGCTASASPAPLPLQPLADETVRLESSSPGAVHRWLESIRRARARGIRALSSMQRELTGGLVAALLFGDLNRLPAGIADLFTRTGTRHMLALSGLHVGLVGWLFALPLARLMASAAGLACGRPGLFSPAIPAALLALLFVPMAGDGAPAARASLALALAALAPRLSRRAHAPNLLGVALTVEVLMDPLAPLRAGVQLSYLATSALIWAAGPVARRVASALVEGGKIAPVWPSGRARSPWVRVGAQRALDAIAVALGASCVASLATLPVAWARFGEFSPIGIVATPLAFPWLVVLVAGGWVWLALGGATAGSGSTLDSLANGTERALDFVANGMIELLSLADRAPWSPLVLPERPVLMLGAGSLAAVAGLRMRAQANEGSGGRACLRLGAMLYATALLPTPGVRASTLEAFVLDVGNGSATVVQAPGEATWIMDAGSRDRAGVARSAVGPLLRRLDVGRLNVWLSHADADHAGALPWLAHRWPVGLWIGPDPPASRISGPRDQPAPARRRMRPSAGRHLVTARDRALSIATIQSGDRHGNESSSMLDVRWRPPTHSRGRRLILTGDAEGDGLATMLDGGTRGRPWIPKGPVDALLLPHHGSPSRHLGWLLDRLLPVEVWASSSTPPPDADEILRRGHRLRSTAEEGPLRWPPSPTKMRGSRGTL